MYATQDNHHHHHQHEQKQQMFEKPLTPSDVGKLNRLVIPKQHAEKHFPNDPHNGLLLTFEDVDECGKLWKFRYSYWNSSQSYVLTKGWSRYVKEKRLDAGDVVLFSKHVLDDQRMFIGWRPRFDAAVVGGGSSDGAHVSETFYDHAWSSYPTHHVPLGHLLTYEQPQCQLDLAEEIYENVDTYQREVVTTRRLRLFGVNLECQDNSGTSHSHTYSSSHTYGSSHGGPL